MAGVKITDLTPLATAASDDLLYIVDVSDTTESPQGTSKQIEMTNILASLDIASGVFSSTYADFVNITPLGTLYSGAWTRIGENISYGTKLSGDLTLAQTSGSFSITLPEIINNLGNDNVSFIIGTYDNVTGNEKAIIYPNSGALTATIEIEGYTAASTFFLFVTAIYKR
jgi:hypothetical protein